MTATRIASSLSMNKYDHRSLRLFLLPWLIVLPLFSAGCQDLKFVWDKEGKDDIDLGVRAEDPDGRRSAAIKNTVGESTYYQGTGPLKLIGYGLVLGLGESGSRDCPNNVYKDLVHAMYKQHDFTEATVGVKSMTPEELIASKDTAVVSVFGEVAPGSLAGDRFDVTVRALSGTQTKSLRGGYLFPMELQMFRNIPERGTITGKVLARAKGPLFVNPFAGEKSATKANQREATILGGGMATVDRDVRLVLSRPSYQLAKRIQDRINGRFPDSKRVAEAVSPSFVKIHIPREYFGDSAHFLALIRALYLSRDPHFEGLTARRLAKEIVSPTAPHKDIALAFEALGQNSIPFLRDLYTHERDHVSFHAAAAGIRLGEHLAVDVMAMHAADPDSPYRYQAIRALGVAKDIGAASMALRDLLHDPDYRVVLASYESLLVRRDSIIHSLPIGRDSFRLDIVPTASVNTIYCKRAKSPRIALFGPDLRLVPPLFYAAPDGCIMLSADQDDDAVRAVRRAKTSGRTSPELEMPVELDRFVSLCGNLAGMDLDEELTGLGLDYGTIVRALHELSLPKSVNARFVMEQPNLAEVFGPKRPTGRPESDL
ncbi:MAG: flagellar basal body P-ring protein FlgI [Phycisphaerae bacterium]